MLYVPKLSLFIICAIIGTVVAIPKSAQDVLMTKGAAPSISQPAANAIPVDPLGVVATVELPLPLRQTRIRMYYQDQKGDIVQHGVEGGPFTTGHSVWMTTMVRANSTRRGTPIAAVSRPVRGHSHIHLYYITPRYTLAEVRWLGPGGLHGGVGKPCPLCIDSAKFQVAQGSQVLYAIQDKDNANILRVGFQSAGMPWTISEAVTMNSGKTWVLAPVPNK